MAPWMSLDLMTVCVFAVACIFVGLTGLIWQRALSQSYWSEAGVFVALLALAPVLWWVEAPMCFWATCLALPVAAVTLVLFRLPVLHRPAFLWTGLLLIGGGTLVAQYRYLDSQLTAELAMDAATWPVSPEEHLKPVETQLAVTDLGRTIPLFTISEDYSRISPDVDTNYLNNRHLGLALIRTDGADLRYNCHGYVFGSSKFWVRGAFVEQILKDNGYVALTTPPRPGDVVVYRENESGMVSHTGIVRTILESGTVLVESKLGACGRFIHTADKHPYEHTTLTYYRTGRGEHVLRGLDGLRRPGAVALVPGKL